MLFEDESEFELSYGEYAYYDDLKLAEVESLAVVYSTRSIMVLLRCSDKTSSVERQVKNATGVGVAFSVRREGVYLGLTFDGETSIKGRVQIIDPNFHRNSEGVCRSPISLQVCVFVDERVKLIRTETLSEGFSIALHEAVKSHTDWAGTTAGAPTVDD